MADSVRLVEARDGTVVVEVDVTFGVRPEVLLELMELQTRLLGIDEGVLWVRVDDPPLALVKQIVERVKRLTDG